MDLMSLLNFLSIFPFISRKLGEIQGKHNVEKSKLIEELNNSKELNSKQETEKLNQQHMISEQKSTIDSLNEKIR